MPVESYKTSPSFKQVWLYKDAAERLGQVLLPADAEMVEGTICAVRASGLVPQRFGQNNTA